MRLRRRDLPQPTKDPCRGVARSLRRRPSLWLGPLLSRRSRRPDRHAQDTLRPALPPLYRRSARGIDALSRRHGRRDDSGFGPDGGERPQLFVPGDTFHTSRLRPGADYALLASTEWPGVEPPDVEHGDIEALIESYSDMAEHIRAFTGRTR